LVVCTREEVFDRIAVACAKATQAVRYRMAMLERRLRQQGIDRALGILHRRIGRGLQQTDEYGYRLREQVRAAIEGRERARRALETRLRYFDVRPRLAADRRRLDAAHHAAVELMRARLAQQRGRLGPLTAKLSQLSPLRVLERGYAIVSNPAGVVTDAAAAPPASRIHVRLHRGTLDATVENSAV
jgi:exodeoxyribonuclease VII large subunit